MVDQMPTWLGLTLAGAATGVLVYLKLRASGWHRFTAWLGYSREKKCR